MAEEIDFENWRISNLKGLVILTLDRVIRHTVVHHLSTSNCIPNFIGIGKTFYGWTYGRTDGHLTHVIRSTLRSRPKNPSLSHGSALNDSWKNLLMTTVQLCLANCSIYWLQKTCFWNLYKFPYHRYNHHGDWAGPVSTNFKTRESPTHLVSSNFCGALASRMLINT